MDDPKNQPFVWSTGLYIPGSSKCVKFVPLHQKKPTKRQDFYISRRSHIYIYIKALASALDCPPVPLQNLLPGTREKYISEVQKVHGGRSCEAFSGRGARCDGLRQAHSVENLSFFWDVFFLGGGLFS